MVESCEHLTKVGLEEKERRDAELDVFRSSHARACSSNQELSVKKVSEFEALKQKVCVCSVNELVMYVCVTPPCSFLSFSVARLTASLPPPMMNWRRL